MLESLFLLVPIIVLMISHNDLVKRVEKLEAEAFKNICDNK